jgi:hypothetical protein
VRTYVLSGETGILSAGTNFQVVLGNAVIPIVIGAMGDPVASGVAASLALPRGNLTGLQLSGGELEGKRLELLQAVVPTISRVAMLVNPANPAQERRPVSGSPTASRPVHTMPYSCSAARSLSRSNFTSPTRQTRPFRT